MVYFSEHYTLSLRPVFTLVQAGTLCKWANDSQHLLLEHFDMIHNSPSYVYHYALPSCPSSSWLHECYITEPSQGVKVVKGLCGWSPCSRTVSLNVVPVSLSYWDNTIAVGCKFGDILILDVVT